MVASCGARPGGRPTLTGVAATPNAPTTSAPTGRRTLRVGHKGADGLVPGNTRASFDAALGAGVDMIEFDVLAEPGTGRLVMAHDGEHLRGAESLEEGLRHVADDSFAGVELDVDLKLPGYEAEVVAALRRFGLARRGVISTQYRESLAALRAIDPGLRIGWSVPRARRDYTETWWSALTARGLLAVGRRVLPRQAAAALRRGRCDALMAHWRLVTPALARAVAAAGGELYVWTVDDSAEIRRVAGLGVAGIISNDPRLLTGVGP